ncbi:MAG: RNA polymerase sigma factor [Thermoanaerobaculia bacterium]|nr:RNA polymerase sigma factor [Thermoanaerobaculia bacterium]
MSSTTSPDQLLAKRAAAGHPEAWDELIELYGRKIYNVAYQFAASKEEAEDLTQEIFLKLYENLDQYRGDVPLVGWTLRLSRNLCIDRYRRTRREKRSTFVSEAVLDRLPAADNPRRDAERREQMRAIYGGLERLPEDLAEVVILADLQGWTLEETATYVDAPLGTVKSRLHRARKRLAEQVEKLFAPSGGLGTPRREVHAC